MYKIMLYVYVLYRKFVANIASILIKIKNLLKFDKKVKILLTIIV